jgi:hypothetical protein
MKALKLLVSFACASCYRYLVLPSVSREAYLCTLGKHSYTGVGTVAGMLDVCFM